MPRITPLNPLKSKRILQELHTDEMPAVLSERTVWKIEHKIPVSFRSAALYCKKLGFSKEEAEDIILKKRAIPILEKILSE